MDWFPDEGLVVDWGDWEGNVLRRAQRENDAGGGHGRARKGGCEGRFARVGAGEIGQRRGRLDRVLVVRDRAQILSVLPFEGVGERVVAFVQVAVDEGTVVAQNQIVLKLAVDYDGDGERGRHLLWLALVRRERARERGETGDAGGRRTRAHGAGRGVGDGRGGGGRGGWKGLGDVRESEEDETKAYLVAGVGSGLRLPVCHFLHDEAEGADAFLLFKVVVGGGGGEGGEEEGVVGGAWGGRAVGGGAWEEGRVGAVDGVCAVSAEGGRGGRGRGTGRRKRQVGVLRKDKVVLVLDPGVDTGVAGGGRVGEELGEQRRVCGVVLGHVLVLHIQETIPRVETNEKKADTLLAILLLQWTENHITALPTEPFPRSTRR